MSLTRHKNRAATGRMNYSRSFKPQVANRYDDCTFLELSAKLPVQTPMKRSLSFAAAFCLLFLSTPTRAATPPLSATARLPIKELTIFKDGHALVLHEGKLATDDAGNVVLDYLPTPVLGTFWPSPPTRLSSSNPSPPAHAA